MNCLVVYFLPLLLSIVSVAVGLELRHRWKSPEFTFPSQTIKQQLTQNNSYVPNTGVILDVDRHEQSRRTFVTLPHFAPGTSVTLAVVSNNNQVNSPLLTPYPDWSWHQPGNCDGLVSVFRVKIDSCDRLWVIDSGVDDVFGDFNQTCPPKIMIFNLLTNKLIKKYVIPSSNLAPDYLFLNIEVEAEPYACQNAHAFVADVGGFTMLVYSLAKDRSWLVNSTSFRPDSEFTEFTVSGTTFTLSDGLLALTLSTREWNDYRLFYHSLSSNCENYVYTSVLKNESNFVNGVNLVPEKFKECFFTRRAQAAAEAIDSNGHLFFGVVPDNSIDCYNVNNIFDRRIHRVVRDDKFLQFVGGMKTPPPYRSQVWAISCRFQLIATTGLNRSEYNFHVLSGSSSLMARMSNCAFF